MVEGLLVVQNFNRDDQSPRYLAFRDAFQERFHRLPGYSSVLAYDAASVLFDALRQKQPSENLKTASSLLNRTCALIAGFISLLTST